MNKLQNFMKTVGTEQKENVVKKSIKSILKWPGGKMKVLQHLKPHFSTSGTFYDVFGGSGVISFNSDAEKIIYNDLNFDCKNLFTHINDPKFIDKLKTLFAKNNKDKYLKYRKLFNTKTSSDFDRACLFYYLNKCGFNGLVRYNKAGGWNVPPGDNLEKRTFDKDDITILKDVIRKKNIEFYVLVLKMCLS
jgi:DNA adenine methylase